MRAALGRGRAGPFLAAVLLSLASAALWPAPTAAQQAVGILGVRLGQNGPVTRLVIETSAPVQGAEISAQTAPDQVTVDLPSSGWSGRSAPTGAGLGLVTGYKTPGTSDYAGEWPRNTNWLKADGTTADLSVVPAAAKNTSITSLIAGSSSTISTVFIDFGSAVGSDNNGA